MGVTIEYIKESLSKGYALTKAKAEPLFRRLLAINAMVYGISILEMAIIGALTYYIIGLPLSDSLSLASGSGTQYYSQLAGKIVTLALVSLPFVLLELFLGAVLGSLSLNVVQDISLGKETDLKTQFMKNFIPVLKLTLVRWGVTFVLLLPLIAMFMMWGFAGIAALCVFGVIMVVILLAFTFAIQFCLYELVLGGKGVIDSMKASYSIVKRNIFSVLLMDALFFAIGFAVGAVVGIFRMVLNPMMSMASAGGMGMTIAAYAIYFILLMCVNAVIMSAMGTITIPIMYNYWKGLRG